MERLRRHDQQRDCRRTSAIPNDDEVENSGAIRVRGARIRRLAAVKRARGIFVRGEYRKRRGSSPHVGPGWPFKQCVEEIRINTC